jgi:hypothetical protein
MPDNTNSIDTTAPLSREDTKFMEKYGVVLWALKNMDITPDEFSNIKIALKRLRKPTRIEPSLDAESFVPNDTNTGVKYYFRPHEYCGRNKMRVWRAGRFRDQFDLYTPLEFAHFQSMCEEYGWSLQKADNDEGDEG